MQDTAGDQLKDRVNAFASSAEGTSLYLLRAIDETVNTLGASERLASASSEIANALAQQIGERRAVSGKFIDPEDVAVNALEMAYKGLEGALPTFVLKKNSIDRDVGLDRDQCELLHNAYATCIESVARLIEALKDLRAAVIRHDLAAELAPTETFDSVVELSKSLRSSTA